MRSLSASFDDYFVRAFWHWGLVVHKLRFPLFVGPFLLTAFLAVGFRWIKRQVRQSFDEHFVGYDKGYLLIYCICLSQKETRDPLFVFSPEDAKWRFERAVLSEHWPLDEQHFWPGKS